MMAEKGSEEEKDILSKAVMDFQRRFIQDDARLYDPGHRFLPLEAQLVKATSADFLPPPGIDPESPAFQNSKRFVEKLIATTNMLRRSVWEQDQRPTDMASMMADCFMRAYQNSESFRNSITRPSQKGELKQTGSKPSEAEKIAEQKAMKLIEEEEEAKSKAQRTTTKEGKQKMKKVYSKPSTSNSVPAEIRKNADGISHGVESLALNDDGAVEEDSQQTEKEERQGKHKQKPNKPNSSLAPNKKQ